MIGGESLRFRRRRFGQIARVRAHTYAQRTPPLDESHRENTNTHTHTQIYKLTHTHEQLAAAETDDENITKKKHLGTYTVTLINTQKHT